LLGSPRPPSEALTDLRAAYARIYLAVAEATSSHVVVDASKGPALGQALAGAPGIDLRMLNVVRDPRAVAWSWKRRVERPHTTSGIEQMWRIPPHRAAAQWSALQLEMEAIARLGGVRSARLRYEDFVADPAGVTRRIATFAGMPAPAVDANTVHLAPTHAVAGNPSRHRTGDVAVVADDEWVRGLSRPAFALVTAITAPLLWRWRYPLRRAAAKGG
jgi:hypothetical protein